MNEEIRKAAVEVGVEWEYMSDGKHVIMSIRSAAAMMAELASLREKLKKAESDRDHNADLAIELRNKFEDEKERADKIEANLETSRQEVERLKGFIQKEAEKYRETAKRFEKIGGCGNPYMKILVRDAKRYEDALLPPVKGEKKEGGEDETAI